MATIEQECKMFSEAVDMILEMTMVQDVGPAAVAELQRQIDFKVYAEYDPKVYKRKFYNHGLIDPREIETKYESQTNTLTVEAVRDDWEPTRRSHEWRKVAPVVESGNGYDYKSIKPRPFHKPAENELIKRGTVDKILTEKMEQYLGPWSV